MQKRPLTSRDADRGPFSLDDMTTAGAVAPTLLRAAGLMIRCQISLSTGVTYGPVGRARSSGDESHRIYSARVVRGLDWSAGVWRIDSTDEVDDWPTRLGKEDPDSANQVAAALAILAREGPAVGRPLVDRVKGSDYKNIKELRPGSSGQSEIRILFAFDPTRAAILLVAGNKARNWKGWHETSILEADRLFAAHLRTLKGQR
ncbi:type II toxin-antitoxin system RelE/ParE family toxin [Micromonospora sp. WMMD980]|uniref:type II toxin-antitoxin system RelE/ParE family toxin n=1 Tax=Micromonospora sp. WMMD980 TaxID=3016088 RepID=UPI002416A71C|nr:type II toxin-antitoxin system RelE/ParE family toxin [Micromonospora sp. WMMD980]MDG4804613.1 type II toxin-antitoxin system RelE/ParE family toxin [Micromonospora sp. WMMD980]